MPRIPLYNQGLGQAVGLATGTLSPRASGAFEAPAQAMTRLASQAGQIAFEFGRAEKNEQTQRKSLEYNMAAMDESADYLRQNTDTETDSFNKGYSQFQTSFLDRIDNDDSLTTSQKNAVKSKVTGTLSRQGIQGEQNAYNRGLSLKGDLMISTLTNNKNTLASLDPADPQYKRIVEENAAIFEDANLKGIKLSITQDNYYRDVKNDRIVMSTTVAIENNDLDRIAQLNDEVDSNKANISATRYSKLKSALRTAEKQIQNQNYDYGLQTVQSALEDMSGQEGKEKAQDLREGKAVTFTTPEGNIVIDPQNMGTANSMALATKIDSLTAEKYDAEGEGFVQEVIGISNEESGSEALFNASQLLSTTNRDRDGNIEIQVQAATILIEDVQNGLEAGTITIQEAQTKLEFAEGILDTDLGNGVANQRIDTLGNTARTRMGSISALRDDINDAIAATAKKNNIMSGLEEGRVTDLILDGVSTTDINDAVDDLAVMYENNPTRFLNILNVNNLDSDYLKTFLGQGTSVARTATEFDEDAIGGLNRVFSMARAAKELGGNVFANNTSKEDAQYFNAVFQFQDQVNPDLVTAIRAVNSMMARTNEAKMASEKQLTTAVEKVKDKFTNVGFLGFGDREVTNSGEIHAAFKRTAKMYLNMTGSVDNAMKLAERDISNLYTLSGNMLIRKTSATEAFRDKGGMDYAIGLVAEDFFIRNQGEEAFAEYDVDDVALMDTQGNGTFEIFLGGTAAVLLAQPNKGTARFSLNDLLIIGQAKAQQEREEARIAAQAESAQTLQEEAEEAQREAEAAEDRIETMDYSPDDLISKGKASDTDAYRAISNMGRNLVETVTRDIGSMVEYATTPETQPQGIISETGD